MPKITLLQLILMPKQMNILLTFLIHAKDNTFTIDFNAKTDEHSADFTTTLFYSSIKPPSTSEPETQTVPFISAQDDFQARYPKLAEEMRKYIQFLQV